MSLEIENKVVLITGANRGIGKALLESFLHHGPIATDMGTAAGLARRRGPHRSHPDRLIPCLPRYHGQADRLGLSELC